MTRTRNAIAGAFGFGTLVGGGLSLALIRFEHHLDHGFYARALDTAAATTLRGAGVAVLAAFLALALRAFVERAIDPKRFPLLLPLATFLVATLPMWLWVPYHARALFPFGRSAILLGLLGAAVVQVIVFVVAHRFIRGRTVPTLWVGAVAVASIVALTCLAGASRARVFDLARISHHK